MPTSFPDRERRFDVDAGFEVPDLLAVVPPGSTVESPVERLRSDYFDTADSAIRRAGGTLRRRTGTNDAGWHLEVPYGEHREELRFDLSDEPPTELSALLLGVTRGAPLAVVATVRTRRQVSRIIDSAGAPVAEVDVDHVQSTGEVDGRSIVSSWTELEVELAGPDVPDEQLVVLERRLLEAGARPARAASELARALGETAVEPRQPKKKTGKKKQRKKTKNQEQRAGEVLLPYLAEQQRALLLGDIAMRRGDDSVIHRTRVATRRLRSALRVFAPFFDADGGRALDEELRWYAEVLGAVRDGDVLEQRLHASLAETAPELILGPVRNRIDAHLDAKRAKDWQHLQEELSQSRYLDLLGEVAVWTDAPPFTTHAARPAAEIVRLARRADRKVSRTLTAANSTGDVDLLHRARKSAKRARYAAEAASPTTGERAIREADRYRRLQDLLGEHQDSVVAAQLLQELGAAAGSTDGENGFTFGLLHQREQERAAAARSEAQRIARRYR